MNNALKLLIIFIFFSFGCSEKKDQQLGYVLIDAYKLQDKGDKLNDLVSEYELIPLQYAGDESLVAIILKTEITSKDIYLLCSKSNNSKYLLIFDINGNFKRRITEIESEELISSKVKYFALDEKENLLILDERNNLVFLDKNFSYHKHIPLPFRSETIYKNKKNLLSYANLHTLNLQPDSLLNDLMVVNENLELINKYLPFQPVIGETRYHHRIHGNIQPSLTGFLFTEFLNDTIYEVNEHDMVPKYVFNFGKQRVNMEEFKEVQLQPFSPILTEKFNWGLNSPIETDDYLFAQYWEKKLPVGIVYSKKNKTAVLYNPMNVLENEDIIPWPRLFREGYYYGYLTEGSFGLMDTEKILRYPASSTVKQTYEHIQANANPVIFKYKLKSN